MTQKVPWGAPGRETDVEETPVSYTHLDVYKRQGSNTQKTNIINKPLESKMFCSGVFIDVSQEFDKVWHRRLLYKILKICHTIFTIFYILTYWAVFQVKFSDATSPLLPVGSGVQQGSPRLTIVPLVHLGITVSK